MTVSATVYFQFTCNAAESSENPDIMAVIELIEDHFAGALKIRSENDTPDFGVLDLIYPRWHGGEPAKARREWTFHSFKCYDVFYRVHTVLLDPPGMATVRGSKRVTFSRKKKVLKFFTAEENKISKTGFVILCGRNLSGTWEIIKETAYLTEDNTLEQ